MDKCSGCGAEIVFGAASCWECNEPLTMPSTSESEPLEVLSLDSDFDADVVKEEQVASESSATQPPGGEDAHQVVQLVPASAVVAYVAQDEVQAVAISQLLSDCGIENFAGHDDETQSGAAAALDASKTMSVQVARENLAAAREIIHDFTSQFEEPAD